MWAPYKELDRRNACFMACPGWKPRIPMGRLARLKARLIGLFHRITERKQRRTY
jgi:hypothetical protein